MFDPTSRYSKLENALLHVADVESATRDIVYKKRRFIPDASGAVTLAQHTVTAGERLDVIVSKYLGDPLQFWRVCDTNDVLSPAELTAEIGTVIRLSLPRL